MTFAASLANPVAPYREPKPRAADSTKDYSSEDFARFINATEGNSGSFYDGHDITPDELLAFERRFTGLGTNALTVNLD